MGSFSRRGNAFGKNLNSSNSKLMQASAQPFGDDSWQSMADFGNSSGNASESRTVLSQLPTGTTRTGRPLIVDSSKNGRIGRGGMASERQMEPSNNGMLGQGIAYSSADGDTNWREAVSSNKVVEMFDPLQSLGACSLPLSNENVPEWRLPSWPHRTESGLSRREPNAPPGKYANDKDSGFSHNGKRSHFLQGQHSKKPGYGGGNYDQQRNVLPKFNHDKEFARRANQQRAMQGLPSMKPAIFGTQDKRKINVNQWENEIARRGRIHNTEMALRQVEPGRNGRKGSDQSWYDIAEIVQTDRIEKICQRMRLISGLLLNNSNYKALEVFSSIMSHKISILKRHLYEKDQSENMFNEILEYLQDFQNGI